MVGDHPRHAFASAFPIVCVGGSAGGLDAYVRLLRNLPDDINAAIVIVNHVRTMTTHLPEILQSCTKMQVKLIADEMPVTPSTVFIIPERHDLHLSGTTFHLQPISKPHGWSDVITIFLKSMTRNWNGQLIAVIVSGYDGDGAPALCGVKDAGGITIAQAPDTASAPDMPQSAISSLCIDFILSPEAIADKITDVAGHARKYVTAHI